MFVFLNGEWVWTLRGLCSIDGEGDGDGEGDKGGAGGGGGSAGGDDAGGDGSPDNNDQGGAGGGDGSDDGGDGSDGGGKLGGSKSGLHATAKGKGADGGDGGKGDGDGDGDPSKGGKPGSDPADKDAGAAITLRDDGTLSIKDAPEWFPKDHVNDDGTLDLKGMAERLHGYRERVRLGKDEPPKEAGDYVLEMPESIKDKTDDIFPDGMDKDPLLGWFKGQALKLGMSPDQFQETAASFVEERAKLMPEPIDGAKEMEKLGPNGAATYAYFADYFNTLHEQGTLNDEDMNEAEVMTMTASGIRFLSKVWEAQGENLGEKRLAHIPSVTKGTMSHAELEAAQAKWEKALNDGNPAAEGELRKLEGEWEKLFGTDPAGSSVVASA